jgi:nitrogen fixation/metabolism regulation signal transduction histidine kinase
MPTRFAASDQVVQVATGKGACSTQEIEMKLPIGAIICWVVLLSLIWGFIPPADAFGPHLTPLGLGSWFILSLILIVFLVDDLKPLASEEKQPDFGDRLGRAILCCMCATAVAWVISIFIFRAVS